MLVGGGGVGEWVGSGLAVAWLVGVSVGNGVAVAVEGTTAVGALGVTGVMASDYYPYLQSRQIFGLLPGVKGAAEYERLLDQLGEASRGMPYQMTSHLLIIITMIIANVGYIARRRAIGTVR